MSDLSATVAVVVNLPSPLGHREAAGTPRESPLQPVRLRPCEPPDGRMTVEGTVVAVRARESERFGTQFGMVVALRNGATVWSSVPRSLDEAVELEPERLQGRRVRFTATFEPSRSDPRFAFARQSARRRADVGSDAWMLGSSFASKGLNPLRRGICASASQKR